MHKAHKSTLGVCNESKKQNKKGGKQKTTPTLRKDPTKLHSQLKTKNSHECTPKSTKKDWQGKNY